MATSRLLIAGYALWILTLAIILPLWDSLRARVSKYGENTVYTVNPAIPVYRVSKYTRLHQNYTTVNLTTMEYQSLQMKKTDPASSGFSNFFEKGMYHCAGWDLALFSSKDKVGIEHQNIYPVFNESMNNMMIEAHSYESHSWMEVFCPNCKGYAGTFSVESQDFKKKLFVINSSSLCFEKEGEAQDK